MDAIHSQKGTHIRLVPPQAESLINAENAGPSTLKYASLGGNLVGSGLIDNLQKKLTIGRVNSVWGMSEGAGVIGWLDDNEEIPYNTHGLSAVGRALPGVKVRISDPTSDKPKAVPRGKVGEFHISSPAYIKHYLFNRNAEEFYKDDEGSWFITGDHALMVGVHTHHGS
jgi:acyl-CoA synthetase (AMP-forming)/AMP-acid ligase II